VFLDKIFCCINRVGDGIDGLFHYAGGHSLNALGD